MKSIYVMRVFAAALLLSVVIGAGQAQLLTLGTRLPLEETSSPEGVPALPTSLYAQIIDPVNGSTADQLVRYALDHNGELAAARQTIAEARGRLRQAGLKANPVLEARGSRAVTSPDDSLSLGAELPLELGGRRQSRIVVAEREIELREAEVADFERRLTSEVRLKYADAIAAARNLKFTEDLRSLTRESHRLVQARVERGKSAPLEQNIVLVELSRVEAMSVSFNAKSQMAIFELKKTLGMLPDEPLKLIGEFFANQQPGSREDAMRAAIASRPDLLAARAAEKLTESQAEQLRVEGRTDASLFAEYQRQKMGFDVQGFNSAGRLAPVQGVFHYVTFGLRVILPTRNKNQGNIEAAVAAIEAARKRREFAEIVVRNEVAAAYSRFELAQSALAMYRDSVRAQALRNLDVIRQTYTLGQKSLLDYVGEQRRYIDIETSYTDVLREYFAALVDIERAAGRPVQSA
jgi:outer membrane protein, heavy metal efflux system